MKKVIIFILLGSFAIAHNNHKSSQDFYMSKCINKYRNNEIALKDCLIKKRIKLKKFCKKRRFNFCNDTYSIEQKIPSSNQTKTINSTLIK